MEFLAFSKLSFAVTLRAARSYWSIAPWQELADWYHASVHEVG
jgi:hypothetical protein